MKWFLCCALALGLTACGDDDEGARPNDAGENDSGGADGAIVDSGTHDTGNDGATVSCGPLTGRTDTCDACLRTSCCFELRGCGNDTGCVALVQCLRGCDEPDAATDCMGACVGTHGVSAAYNPLVICGANACADQCPFSSP